MPAGHRSPVAAVRGADIWPQIDRPARQVTNERMPQTGAGRGRPHTGPPGRLAGPLWSDWRAPRPAPTPEASGGDISVHRWRQERAPEAMLCRMTLRTLAADRNRRRKRRRRSSLADGNGEGKKKCKVIGIKIMLRKIYWQVHLSQ